ncbi:hypothetical protein JB92DRAFT_3031987 [Gautieria morchelliformis]|nr:hypothetical protein JB92DRAFT_3031987 [Gautieria morchelliformis]
MQPIPPAVFYNTPSTPIALSPALFSNSTNTPHPPAVALSLITSVAAPPSTPDESSNTGLDASGVLGSQPVSSRKVREAFSLHDLDQLLCAVIEVNPYMAPWAKLGEHWKEVARHVQESRSCLNREPDTLKNKVASLLAWVEVVGAHPALFASLSGKLDAVQHLKLEVKGTREEQKEREKQVQNAAKDEGETMRDAMLLEEACAETRKMRGAEREEERKAHQVLLEETRCENDQQERTSTALLDILWQGLLN